MSFEINKIWHSNKIAENSFSLQDSDEIDDDPLGDVDENDESAESASAADEDDVDSDFDPDQVDIPSTLLLNKNTHKNDEAENKTKINEKKLTMTLPTPPPTNTIKVLNNTVNLTCHNDKQQLQQQQQPASSMQMIYNAKENTDLQFNVAHGNATAAAAAAASMPNKCAGQVVVPKIRIFPAINMLPQTRSVVTPSANLSPTQLQALLAANPSYLVNGIPNEVLVQVTNNNNNNNAAAAAALALRKNLAMKPVSGPRMLSVSGYTGMQLQVFHPTQNIEDDVDYEEIGIAETYANYTPTKLRLGCRHPDPVVETASLSSVESIPVTYKLALPPEVILSGQLSSLQLEAIIYASQAHEHMLPDKTRAGFFLGDGAGVGKGRTIAGLIYENFLHGRRRALWISVSNDLRYDAERDLRDIGAEFISVYSLNKFKYSKISSQESNCRRGVIFCTYASLIGESNTTTSKYRSRFKQLLQWCGHDFEGVIVFDECHKAKNLSLINLCKSTKTGATVLELQKKLPNARVVYASATGASEPRNMAYMVRLGLCGEGTPFVNFNEFVNAVEARGVGGMEIVAMDLKLRGMYIARQLSFKEVTFRIEEVPLTKKFRRMYNRSVNLWVEAMTNFGAAVKLMETDKRSYKVIWCQFWCAHQRFFKYLCIASKVEHAVAIARNAIKNGKCVVIGLQSTGESRTLDQLERDDGQLNEFISTAKNIFLAFVEKHFPAPDRERFNHLMLTGEILPVPDATGANVPQDVSTVSGSGGNCRSDKRAKRQRLSRLYSSLGLHYEYDSDLDRTDSDSEYEQLLMQDTDSEEDATSLSKGTKQASKRRRGRPRKQNKEPKEKLSVQGRILEVLQVKLGLLKTNENVSQTDANGMPLHKSTEELLAREQLEKNIEIAISLRESLMCKIEQLGCILPPNTLDHLIDELGGPENVAEMTGRRGRIVQGTNGCIRYETRCEYDAPMETINIIEKKRFMNGEKDVAIISEAASSGISLQSDRRCKNQRRRVHITLELPWSADRAVQQFGRTHRSNQVNAPEYIFLISDLAGERRFAATVAKRLESLGALTHGDRRATDTRDLSQFNIDNKYGRAALEAIMKAITGEAAPIVPPPKNYSGGRFFEDCADGLVGVGMLNRQDDVTNLLSLDKEYNNISKFLNRILGCHVELQNKLFKYFTDTMAYIVNQMKRSGKFDMGILDLGAHGEHIELVSMVRFIRKHATGLAPTDLYTVNVSRGMPWSDAVNKYGALVKPFEGFYLTKQNIADKRGVVLVVEEECKETSSMSSYNMPQSTVKNNKDIKLRIYRPNTGLQVRSETFENVEKRYTRCTSVEAEPFWQFQFNSATTSCSHVYWTGFCRYGPECQVGLRKRVYHILSGLVLPIWTRVEQVLNKHTVNPKMQVIRLKTTSGRKIVGTMIDKTAYLPLINDLKSDSERVEEFAY